MRYCCLIRDHSIIQQQQQRKRNIIHRQQPYLFFNSIMTFFMLLLSSIVSSTATRVQSTTSKFVVITNSNRKNIATASLSTTTTTTTTAFVQHHRRSLQLPTRMLTTTFKLEPVMSMTTSIYKYNQYNCQLMRNLCSSKQPSMMLMTTTTATKRMQSDLIGRRRRVLRQLSMSSTSSDSSSSTSPKIDDEIASIHVSDDVTVATSTTTTNQPQLSQQSSVVNQIIYQVAYESCKLLSHQISITWKPSKALIIVTVLVENVCIDGEADANAENVSEIVIDEDGNEVLDANDDDNNQIVLELIDEKEFLGETDDTSNENDDEIVYTDNINDDRSSNTDNGGTSMSLSTAASGTSTTSTPFVDIDDAVDAPNIDLTVLARAINVALEEYDLNGSHIKKITETFDIEVSTPGFDTDEITTPRMFRAYRGFDVIVHAYDKRKKVYMKYEGRLVEKNYTHVVINMKGRMKRFLLEHVKSVMLPTFQHE